MCSSDLGTTVPGTLRGRIQQCRLVGAAGIDGKADDATQRSILPGGDRSPIVLPPAQPAGPPPHIVTNVTVMPNAGQSPRQRACNAYADNAVAQFQAQASAQCGQSGPRWHADRQDHYNWCMNVPTPQLVESEAGERSRILNACLYRW